MSVHQSGLLWTVWCFTIFQHMDSDPFTLEDDCTYVDMNAKNKNIMHCAKNRNVAGSIPVVVIGIFH
jgi:hypothetical protein